MGRWGKFITFEGIDRSGKSTLISAIKERLLKRGIKEEKILITKEPGGTDFAELLRDILAKNVDREPLAELFALLSARYDHTKRKIIPALREGKIVICDRYSDSTFAYQVFGKGLEYYLVTHLNKIASLKLKPDLTILIDLDPKIALERLKDKRDHYESLGLEFFERVRYGYLALAKRAKKRIKVIDGNRSFEDVLNDAWSYVEKLIFGEE
ncbi:MAG: dTMP kinase [Candidatus Caldipriscus sp.]